MTIARKVDASPLCRRELDLFCNEHNAWDHMGSHVLDARESAHWALLIPALKVALDGGQRGGLWEKALASSPYQPPPELDVIWHGCLDDDRVRTGFLPFKGELPPGLTSDLDRQYHLFVACWRKARHLYQRSLQDRRFVTAPAALHELMRKVPDRPAWEKLR
jgi:hypothetical protein